MQHGTVFPGGGEEGEGSEKGEDVPSEAGASTSKAASAPMVMEVP